MYLTLAHPSSSTWLDKRPTYVDAVERAFGKDIDYAMLIKRYGVDPEAARPAPAIVTFERMT